MPSDGLQKEDPELSQLREAAADTARDMKEAVTPSQEAGKASGKESKGIMDTVSMLPVQASCCLLGRQCVVAEKRSAHLPHCTSRRLSAREQNAAMDAMLT